MTCAECAFNRRCDAYLRLTALLDATRYLRRTDFSERKLLVEWAEGCRSPERRKRPEVRP